jgi:hypothetical protein
MKLVADWGVHSPRLDRLIAAECSHCDGGGGRLVRHDARRGGTQVWLSCASCCARLGNALPHSEQPRWVHIRARGSRGLVHLPALNEGLQRFFDLLTKRGPRTEVAGQTPNPVFQNYKITFCDCFFQRTAVIYPLGYGDYRHE